MIGSRRNPSPAQVSPEIIAAFKALATPLLSDNLARLPAAVGLRPFHRGGTMAGTALTVRTRPGDNLTIHQALELVRPGDVIVVDGGGDLTRALVGEIMTTIARFRGAAGFVVDGAIRDTGVLVQSDFPCFARAAIHLGPARSGPGDINVPVSIGGMVVEPGDIVVGDADGLVAFPPSVANELLQAARQQQAKEAEILLSIREGRYKGA